MEVFSLCQPPALTVTEPLEPVNSTTIINNDLVDLTITNFVCNSATFEAGNVTSLNNKKDFTIATQFSMDCAADYELTAGFIQNTGSIDVTTINNEAMQTITADCDEASTAMIIDSIACVTSVTVDKIDFRGGVIAAFFELSNQLIEELAENEVENIACNILSSPSSLNEFASCACNNSMDPNATMVSTFSQTNTPTSASTLETTTEMKTAITTITELPTTTEIPDSTFVDSDFPTKSLTSFELSKASVSTIFPSDTYTDDSATSTTTTTRGSSDEISSDTPEPTKTTTKSTTKDSTLSVQTVAPTFSPTTRLPTAEKTPTISPSEQEEDTSGSVIRFGLTSASGAFRIATITAGFLFNIVIDQL